MGISLDQYRAKIGVFAGGSAERANKGMHIISANLLLLGSLMNNSLGIRLCLFSLLVLSNVEKNPGPETGVETRSQSQMATAPATKKDIDAILEKLNDISQDAKEIKSRFAYMETRMNNIEESLHNVEESTTENSGRIDNIEAKLSQYDYKKLRDELHETRQELQQQRRANEDISNRMRRCNLVFYGIEQTDESEDWAKSEQLITDIITDKFDITDRIQFERVHRMEHAPLIRGSKPIIAQFSFFKDKDRVLQNAWKLKGSNIGVDGDFAKGTRVIRRKLLEKRKELIDNKVATKAKVTYDKLLVTMSNGDRKVYTYDDVTRNIIELQTGHRNRRSQQHYSDDEADT